MSDPLDRLKAALSDRYVLERELGQGGMATVWLAHDLKHDRDVALKVLRPELAASVGPERFLAEIRLTARLQHPHIVALFDSGEADGFLYYVMPRIEGESLRARLEREKRLDVEAMLAVAHPVAQALAYAHEQGIVHRDIKPENILLSRGQPFVTDFGIAQAVSVAGGERLTATGVAVGTPAYMSPEQVFGDGVVDARSDVYSLGCVIYEMLGGAPPFTGATVQAMLAKRLSGPPPPLPSVPGPVDAVVRRSLATEPRDRFATALALADALLEAARKPATSDRAVVAHGVEEQPISAPSEATALRDVFRASARGLSALAPWRRKAVAVLAVLALGAAAVVVVTTFSAPGSPPRLVVLPFENRGPPEDGPFTAGITDVITARLAGISGIQVISPTSAVRYAGSELAPRQIGQELGVDYILEGTVQRERPGDPDSRLRIIPQLIRAEDDVQVWAETYDDLMSGAFALQSDLAERVAAVLEVAVLERERQALVEPPTRVPQAYELYLTARGYSSIHEEQNRVGVELLQRAVQLDSTFAEASALLSTFHAYAFLYGFDRSPERLALAREAATRALEVDPDNPSGHRALGRYYLLGHRDYDRALEEYSLAEAGLPNDDALLTDIAYLQRRRGELAPAVIRLEKAAVLNPGSSGLRWQLGLTYGLMGRYAEAATRFEESISLAPDVREPYGYGAWNYLLWDGSAARARALLDRMPEAIDPAGQTVFAWYEISLLDGSFAALLERLQASPVSLFQYQQDLMPKTGLQALLHLRLGNGGAAAAYADSARAWLVDRSRATQEDPRIHKALGLMHAVLGNADEAIHAGERAVELEPIEKDRTLGPYHVAALAEILVLVGEHERALDHLERLAAIPAAFVVSPAKLAADPRWAPIRQDPRFRALLAR